MCLKAAVYPCSRFVTFRRPLRLACNSCRAIQHAVFSNPSSSFWCHLQWEVLHCAIWLTLSISCHSALFFTSLTSSLRLLWHNLSPAFFFKAIHPGSVCWAHVLCDILLLCFHVVLHTWTCSAMTQSLMRHTAQQLRVQCLLKGHAFSRC